MKKHDNSLYYGDCLEVMKEWPPESVDLIYLDPPFNSNVKYNVLFSKANPGEMAQFQAFDDTWHWDEAAIERYGRISNALASPLCDYVTAMGKIIPESGMLSYLTSMGERLVAMRRLLKSTGSIYLHCDPTASHYLKLLMDAVFGGDSFQNEIIWHYDGPQRPSKKRFGSKHEVILRYSKTDRFMANENGIFPLKRIEPEKLSQYKYLENRGYYYTTPRGDYTDESIKRLESEGRVEYTRNGIARVRHFLTQDAKGYWYRKKQLHDVWSDIVSLGHAGGKESIGYPTQKPKALLERIIKASSNEGDLVLDPYCGCGTTIEVAHNLQRRWIGIDISSYAVELVKQKRLKGVDVKIHGIPADLKSARKMAKEEPFQFESWAVMMIPGMAPNKKQVGDGGIDGRGALLHEDVEDRRLVVAQVKGGKGKPTIDQVRAFARVIDSKKAAMGIFITPDGEGITVGMRDVARGLGSFKQRPDSTTEYPRMQFWSIGDFFDDKWPSMPAMLDPYTGKKTEAIDLFGHNPYSKGKGKE